MYNPSNHIPLSKPLGAAAFPIDGKFMFYTNGAGGVYAYRPFLSIAEVLAYFPLGSNFRGNTAGQPWAFEVLVNTGGTLSGDGGSITGGVNDVYWWRNGVTDADLVLKANGSTPTTDLLRRVFLIPSSDITDGSVNITGRTNEQGDTVIPSDAVVSVYEGGKIIPATYYENGLIEGLDGSLDVKVVLIGGEAVDPSAINLTNDSGVNMIYSINNGSIQNFLVNQTIQVTPGDSLILATSTEPIGPLALRDQSGYLLNTDGASNIESTPHQWNIPLNTTSLNIESGLG